MKKCDILIECQTSVIVRATMLEKVHVTTAFRSGSCGSASLGYWVSSERSVFLSQRQ